MVQVEEDISAPRSLKNKKIKLTVTPNTLQERQQQR